MVTQRARCYVLTFRGNNNIKMKTSILSVLVGLLLSAFVFSGEPPEILLWPDGAPGSEGKTGTEKVRMAETGDHVISNIHRPSIMGFSAGGEVAALASMRFDRGNPSAKDAVDRESSRPAFQALIYPGGSGKFEVNKDSPPIFLLGGYGDRPDIAEGLAQVYIKYKEAGIPAELHIYSNAGHGFGIRKNNQGAMAGWPQRLADWLADRGMLK